MSLKYSEKASIDRKINIESKKQEILRLLEEAKHSAMKCDNLRTLSHLENRANKLVNNPRRHEYDSEKAKKTYQETKERTLKMQKEKRARIHGMIPL